MAYINKTKNAIPAVQSSDQDEEEEEAHEDEEGDSGRMNTYLEVSHILEAEMALSKRSNDSGTQSEQEAVA